MSNPILNIVNSDVYRGDKKVFSQLNLTIEEGQNTAILGSNGAGKTTLLKLLTREIYPVDKPDSQFEIFGNRKVNIWELRQKIGVVSYDYQANYLAMATGLDVVLSAFFGSVGIHGHNVVEPHHIEAATQILHTLEIEHLKDKQYLLLSTGQQRRLLLARALIHNPRALVFDEPTSGLDIKASHQLLHDLRELTQHDKTLILVTHHIQEIIPEIERVILLKDGEIYKDGDKRSVLTDDHISHTFDIPVAVTETNGYFVFTPRDE